MKAFGSFRLDILEQCLWREGTRIALTPKVFAVLRHLVDHPGRLVTQDELLEAIWPETYVQPEILRKYILELRKVLGDDPKSPRFIETLPKRGYRFMAAMAVAPLLPALAGIPGPVGRDRELAALDGHLRAALQGQRRLVLVTGEAGIGKSTLLDAFEQRLAGHEGMRIARGQCVEGFGGKEAYYPVLEAFGQLIRGPGAEGVIQILAAQAPTWLIQFPSRLKAEQREALQREILGATRERMLREICQALESLTVADPLALILEDLHWADPSTLDLISALARRRGPCKLLVLGTYRPVDVILLQSPLKALRQDLVMHKLCFEIALERLTEADVTGYLAAEFPGKLPAGLAELVYRHSEGNPLFMTAIVSDLEKSGLLIQEEGLWRLTVSMEQIVPDVPETLQQMLEIQVERLSEAEQRVLKSASIAGRRFSAWSVAAMLDTGIAETEDICERFAQRQQFLRPGRAAGVLGGAQSAHYEFRHSLYREALYRRIPEAQRALWHRRLAERAQDLLPASHGMTAPDTALELASELALHFEHGRDFESAARYLILSAENAGRRYAHRDAAAILEHALGLLSGIAPGPGGILQIEILERISDARYAVGDLDGSAEADGAVIALAEERGLKAVQVNALTRLARVLAFSDPDACVTVCERAVRVCGAHDDLLLQARTEMLAGTWQIITNGWSKQQADRCDAARKKITDLLGPEKPAYHEILYAHVQALHGEYRDAYEIARSGLEKAVETHSLVVYLSSLSSLALALMHLGWWGELRGAVESGMELAEKNGNQPWRALFAAMLGWLHMQAFDFRGARRIAEGLIESHAEEPAGQVRTMANLTIAYADLASGQAENALQLFLKVRDRQRTPKFFLQWYWRMISEFGLVGAYFELEDLGQATTAAEQFLEDALTTADPALRAPAWDAMARVAAKKGEVTRALECMEQAFASLEDHDLPSVAWRLHATAAHLHIQTRDFDASERHCLQAASSLHRAAASFGENDPLRQSLLTAAETLKADFRREMDVARPAGRGK
ncbi:MAG TPA: AAA family ATPase [Bryobacteraceae bacterium]|nr:AAA family ATPase [Bryobacteraceae bacterium]